MAALHLSFVLLVRHSGVFGGERGAILGALLITVTMATVAFILHALVVDVQKDAAQNDTEHEAPPAGPESVAEEETGPEDAARRNGLEIEMTALGSTSRRTGGPSPSSTGEEETPRLVTVSRGDANANFLQGMLTCVVGQTQLDDAAATAMHADNTRLREEVANLRSELARTHKQLADVTKRLH